MIHELWNLRKTANPLTTGENDGKNKTCCRQVVDSARQELDNTRLLASG